MVIDFRRISKKYFSREEQYVDEHAAFFQTSVDYKVRYQEQSTKDLTPTQLRKQAENEGIGLLKVN